MPIHPEAGRDETEQVLFALLLVVPFNDRFANVTSFQRGVYFATLLFAAAASVAWSPRRSTIGPSSGVKTRSRS